jgi:hypothetical protein
MPKTPDNGARAALAVTACALLVFAGSGAASQSAAPPAAPDFVVINQIDSTQTVESADLPLLLTKAKRVEHALVRRVLFITATLRLTQPPAPLLADAAQSAPPPPKQTCRWTYRAFLQREICFVSMSGLTSCTQPEVISLPDTAEGDAPISDAPQQGVCNDIFRPAMNARIPMTTALLSRSKALFAADQKTKVDAQFKAAGVRVTADVAAPVRAAK